MVFQRHPGALIPTKHPGTLQLLHGHVEVKVAAETLREAAETKAKEMADQNPTRQHLVEKLEELVAAYNAGSIDAQAFFDALGDFVDSLDEEESRAAREGLNEEELAIFDLLTRPAPTLTQLEEIEVKKFARELLERLRELLAAIDWRSGQQTRAAVESAIRFKLNELPEAPYPEILWNTKVDSVWQFVMQKYGTGQRT
jgi:type I restriction enzyme, R subunit